MTELYTGPPVLEPPVRLELSEVQRQALSAAQFFADHLAARESEDFGGRGTFPLQVSMLRSMLAASVRVATDSLPDCPYDPPGSSIDDDWSLDTPVRLILRCAHSSAEGGPHCWTRNGDVTTC